MYFIMENVQWAYLGILLCAILNCLHLSHGITGMYIGHHNMFDCQN